MLYESEDGLRSPWLVPLAKGLITDLAAARTNRLDGQKELRHVRAFWEGVLAAATRSEPAELGDGSSGREDQITETPAESFARQAASGMGVLGTLTHDVYWRQDVRRVVARNCRLIGGSITGIRAHELSFYACSLVRFDVRGTAAQIVDVNHARIAGVPRQSAVIDLQVEKDGEFRARSSIMRYVTLSIKASDGHVDFGEADLSSLHHIDQPDLMALAVGRDNVRVGRDNNVRGAGAARFELAHLKGADFSNAALQGVTFDRCELEGANFTGACFDHTSRVSGGTYESDHWAKAVFEGDCQGSVFPDGIPESLSR